MRILGSKPGWRVVGLGVLGLLFVFALAAPASAGKNPRTSYDVSISGQDSDPATVDLETRDPVTGELLFCGKSSRLLGGTGFRRWCGDSRIIELTDASGQKVKLWLDGMSVQGTKKSGVIAVQFFFYEPDVAIDLAAANLYQGEVSASEAADGSAILVDKAFTVYRSSEGGGKKGQKGGGSLGPALADQVYVGQVLYTEALP